DPAALSVIGRLPGRLSWNRTGATSTGATRRPGSAEVGLAIPVAVESEAVTGRRQRRLHLDPAQRIGAHRREPVRGAHRREDQIPRLGQLPLTVAIALGLS